MGGGNTESAVLLYIIDSLQVAHAMRFEMLMSEQGKENA